MVLCLCIWDDLRGARQLGAEHRATYLYSVDPRDLDHDAVIRIGGRAPERWAHSTRRPESHSWVRVTTTSDRHRMPAEFALPRPESVVYLAGFTFGLLLPRQGRMPLPRAP